MILSTKYNKEDAKVKGRPQLIEEITIGKENRAQRGAISIKQQCINRFIMRMHTTN